MSTRGAFVDTKGVRWDTNDADFEGMLMKKSRWVGEWRKRYMILKGSKLFYAANASVAPHGVIDLVDCLAVKPAGSKSGKKNAFEILLKNESILSTAKTERERDDWIGQIGTAIVKHSSMYVNEDGEDDIDNADDATASSLGNNVLDSEYKTS